MRNVLVVLVPLCFGLASGFIVPSGIQEIITDLKDVNSTNNSARKTRNMLRSTEETASTRTSDMPMSSSSDKHDNGSLDTDLYEHSDTKESDVKARAYIYIKQNGKKPIRNRLFDSPRKIPQQTHKSYLFNMNKVFEELPRQFSIGYMSQNIQTNTESVSDHRCHKMERNRSQKKSDAKGTQQYKTFSNEQLEFLELLKAPLLRAEFKNLDKNQYKYLTVDHQKGDTSNVLFNPSKLRSEKSDQLVYIGNVNGNARDDDEVISLDEISQKSYRNNLHNDKSLLDELIKQKLNERGSLFGCHDCLNKAKKDKFSNS